MKVTVSGKDKNNGILQSFSRLKSVLSHQVLNSTYKGMLMIRSFTMAAAVLALAAGSALAADLPSRKAPPVYIAPPPLFTWTGVYIGGQIGYGFGTNHSGIPGLLYTSSSPEGVLGGAHVGYNYQVNQFVFGLEGDVDGSSISKSIYDPITGGTFGTRIPVEGSVRGRAGVAFDRALIYATGGAAFADLEHSYSGLLATPYYGTSTGRVGWTVGGGVEYAVTNNWSIRGEYRYSDFGHSSDFVTPAAIAVNNHVTEHAVRVGFSYKFDMYAPPAPVVAKY
jgi:outer membrane immunogenic protein